MAERRPRPAGPRVLLGFLPAALEVQVAPPPRAARAVGWSLMLLFVAALAWGWFGRVDIVAVAPGKVIPSGRVKTVQPLETARVERILVHEGARVAGGQPLVRLDATVPAADRARLEAEAERLHLAGARLRGQLAWWEAGGAQSRAPLPPLETGGLPPGLDPAVLAREQARGGQAVAQFAAALAALRQDGEARRAARAALGARIARLDAVLPLIEERAEALRSLAARGLGARVEWLALEEQRVGEQRERAVLVAERAALDAEVAGLEAQGSALEARTQEAWLGELAETETRLAALAQELTKARGAEARQTLLAPVSGTVQQLAVHTEGGVVTAAQPLMVVVPEDDAVRLEVAVGNRDIGFVHEGQRAVVKVETFPFTRYGTLGATLTRVSRDAVSDPQRGLLYLAELTLDQTALEVEGRPLPLAHGMAVSAEILTGRRRLIDFLWSPLARRVAESARER